MTQNDCRILVAPVTPMTADGELNLTRVPAMYRTLRARGADGFYLCGGTGEGMLMDVEERMRVVDAWRDAAGDEASLIVHVGAAATRDARKLARHAEACGVAAISSVSPPVYLAADMQQLVASFAQIAEAAPSTPFYFYHNSFGPGPKVSGYDFLTAAQAALPTLAGIKFTHEDLLDLSRCLRFADGRYQIYYGKDEFLLGAHAIGATRFIGGSFNVICPLVKQILRAFAEGNVEGARAVQHKLVDVVVVLRRFGGLPAVKATMAMLGVPCGPVRLPLRPVPATQHDELFAQLHSVWPEIADASEMPQRQRLSVSIHTNGSAQAAVASSVTREGASNAAR
jgi:N-acetylneuraminate lyase